jgi:hypothetical protein
MHGPSGSCHCGNVEFTHFAENSADDLVPRRRSCSPPTARHRPGIWPEAEAATTASVLT